MILPIGAAPIVVGFDGSPSSERAALLALGLAERLGSEVYLVYASQGPIERAEPVTEEESGMVRTAVESAFEELRLRGAALGIRVLPVVRETPPGEAILTLAEELRAGIILVGTRGLSLAGRAVLGSVSTRVVTHSKVPVTVVP